ncbi:hypothetical protein PNEG_01291 [Pneumocystis murina B123]|uniref:Uncharacterized protein n=1 Tax=Pneumocystis murina (strain B123) TaxID=1069680 RepID=M7NTZ2_PNEMU|nr:hypothetical protein PNEG_01291 [Pneumocystis murina B123]EMR10586.1 hypothetical protein PNEG_01291 [Pneumocystis murina B123]
MIEFDEKTQSSFIEWITYKLSIYENSIKNNIFKQNKYAEYQYEISENIRKVLIHSKPEELVTFLKDKKDYILLYCFFYIFNNIECSLAPHIQISLFQTLNTWLSRCIRCVELFPPLKDELVDIFGNLIWEKLYDFVWERWEVSNIIQNILRELFTKLLSLQKIIIPYEDFKKSLNKILYRALNENTSMKASIYIIDILTKFLEVDCILTIEPNFFISRVLFLKDIGLAPALSKMLINFLTILKQNLDHRFQKDSSEIWIEYWLPHVIECFCKDDIILKQNIAKWLLPGILEQSIECYKIVINRLKNSKLSSDQYFSLLIIILKIGNNLNILQEFNSQNLKNLGLFQNTLLNLLNSSSISNRLSLLSLIVETSKLSTPISSDNLTLIMETLPNLIIDSNSSSRSCIIDIVNKILLRLCSCSHSFSKKLKKMDQTGISNEEELTNILTNIENFILWLYDFIKSEMLPSLSYTRVVTALNIMKKLINTGIDPNISLNFEKKTKISFHFSLRIFDATMIRILTDQFMNSYEEPQKLAIDLLSMSTFPIHGLTQNELTLFFNRSLELIKSNRTISAEGGAKALLFIFEKIIVKHEETIKTEDLVSKINILDNPIKIIEILIEELRKSIQIGSKNLLLGVNSFPLHGNLLTLQHILNSIHSKKELYIKIKDSLDPIYNKLICFCEDIWKIVNPILCDDSFENLFSEKNKNISKNEEDIQYFMEINNLKISSNHSQIILAYSWRSIKEASMLLAIILSRSDKTNQLSKATYEQYNNGGKLFKEWLINIRHPGALFTIYSNFIILCSTLFISSEKELNSLPESWLQKIIFSLRNKSSFIAKKSRGLPYCITGILVSETNSSRPLLLKTIEELMTIAEINHIHQKDRVNTAQIHAYDTLRVIFLESRLSNISTRFIEKGFVLSINGFNSNIWTVRNCSMMLFSSLLTRVFGSKKHKQDSYPTVKTMSSKTFFNKYPKLREYLLQQLKYHVSYLDNYNENNIYVGLNPILTLISYLEVTMDYSNNEWVGMDKFMPFLDHCSKIHIWKVREMSAKAISTIIFPSMRINTIISILESCESDIQNTLHGNLLKIKYLIQSWINYLNKNIFHINDLQAFYTNVTNALIKKFENIVSNNPCAITKSLVLEIIFLYFIDLDWIKEKISSKFENTIYTEETMKLCIMTIEFCIDLFQSKKDHQKIIGMNLFLKQASIILLYGLENFPQRIKKNIKNETIIIDLLENSTYDVKLSIFNHLRYTTKTTLVSSSIIFKIFSIILKERWEVLTTSAALSLSNLLNISSFSSLNIDDLKIMIAKIILLLKDSYSYPLKMDALISLTSALLFKLWHVEPKDIYWEQFNQWIKYLDLNSDEDKDRINRMSVMQSLKCFSKHLILNKISDYSSQQSEYIIPIYFILLKLLKDDDEKIRELASEIVSQIIFEKNIFSPAYSSKLLLNHLSSIYKYSFTFKKKLLNLLINSENIDELQAILSYSQETNNLFIYEKKNLWRDTLRDNYEIIKTLALLDDNGYIVNKLTIWANSFAKTLLQIVIEKGYDGHLGWTSNGDVYNIISKFIYIVQYLEKTSKKEESYIELRDIFEKIIIESERINIHKCLFNSKIHLDKILCKI